MKLIYQELGFKKESYKIDLEHEIEILGKLNDCESSVRYYGYYDQKNAKILVLEKCDQDLKQYMEKTIKRNLTVEEIKKIFIKLNEVFKKMQKEHIIHRDLKLENFLIKYIDDKKTNFIVKLSDYGISKYLNKGNTSFTEGKGTHETTAPEIILTKPSEHKSLVDIFSLGVILYQLSHNLKHPFLNFGFGNIDIVYYNNYDEDKYDIEFDNSIKNGDFKDLLKKMLRLNPKNRLTWEQYFEHSFFK